MEFFAEYKYWADGSAHFRREKFIPKGGPDGGDGGKGGNIVLKGNENLNTLLDLRYKKYIKAKRGEHGMKSRKTGAGGENIVLEVPLGTVAYDAETKERLGEITEFNEELVIAEPLASIIEDQDDFRAALKQYMWSSCKACHSRYRAPH